MNLPEHKGMNHAALAVKDLKRSLDFYINVLNFLPYHIKDNDWAMVYKGATSISLVPNKDKDSKKANLESNFHPPHLGINVSHIKDVDAYYEYLKSHHVEIPKPPKGHRDGSKGFYFFDTEDNLLELIYIPEEPIQKKD